MAEPVMKYGARKGRMSMMRKWIAKASANDIRIFPVPGVDILRMHEDEMQHDFIIAPNPREANVLLVIGELTEPLARKAAVTYQQIPRPRVLVVGGIEQPPHLPKPDIQLSLGDGFLVEALLNIRRLLRNYAWSEEAEPWEPAFLKKLVEDAGNGGHEHHHHNHGNESEENDKEHDCGHEENHDGHESHKHPGNHDHESEKHKKEEDHNPEEHKHSGHEEHDHHGDEAHDHGDMDFMSMVAMTNDLPRSKDGLPMNRSEVRFGPYHPGLPGGLSVLMELDGDTVIEARVESDMLVRDFSNLLPVDTQKLPDLLARLNPLTPQTYWLLAQKALANARHDNVSLSSNELTVLENERIGSHLNWLATFAKTVGSEWMHQEAARWHALHRSKSVVSPEKLCSFLEQIRAMPYLRMKLSVEGIISDNLLHHLSGPVAKARGINKDVRLQQKQYLDLGWTPITNTEYHAWGRLLVRLDEIKQSLELISKADKQETENNESNLSGSGEGVAKLESPRGTLKLRIRVKDSKVDQLDLETPSQPLAGLVPTLTEAAELSDALVQIASLDITPWEVACKGTEAE